MYVRWVQCVKKECSCKKWIGRLTLCVFATVGRSEGSLTDNNTETHNNSLSDYLPTAATNILLSGSSSSSSLLHDNKNLHEHCVTQPFAAWTVYVLLSNPQSQGPALRRLFSGMPCRFYQLSPSELDVHGINGKESNNNNNNDTTITISQRAALHAVREDNDTTTRRAVLLLGADDRVISYAACDAQGRVWGHGLVPGLVWQWQALQEHMDNSSWANAAASQNNLNGTSSSSSSQSFFFSDNVARTAVRTLLEQLRGTLHSMVKELEHFSDHQPVVVWVYGPHEQVLRSLLLPVLPDGWQLHSTKHPCLAHYGMAAVLRKRGAAGLSRPLTQQPPRLWDDLVGLRVVDSENHPGTVVTVRSDERDLYRVNYDQGESEEMGLLELAGTTEWSFVCLCLDTWSLTDSLFSSRTGALL